MGVPALVSLNALWDKRCAMGSVLPTQHAALIVNVLIVVEVVLSSQVYASRAVILGLVRLTELAGLTEPDRKLVTLLNVV